MEKKFSEEKKHRWFINYVSMMQRIKERITLNINPLIQELEETSEKYSKLYEKKDLKFHITQALKHCFNIKSNYRELIELYYNQADYQKIQEKWKFAFITQTRELKDLKARMFIIKRILKNQ